MGKWLCEKIKYLSICFIEILYSSENLCHICGLNLKSDFPICETCFEYLPFLKETNLNYNLALKKVYSIFEYKGKIKELICDLKYNKEANIAEVIAYLMADFIKKNKIKVDYLVPIPMHSEKIKNRGYNHSYLIAKKVGEILNIKVENCLEKTKNTKNQVLLNSKERWYNIKGSIKGNFKYLNKNILLIDDVVTTGATAHFSALALKGNKVSLLSFATSNK